MSFYRCAGMRAPAAHAPASHSEHLNALANADVTPRETPLGEAAGCRIAPLPPPLQMVWASPPIVVRAEGMRNPSLGLLSCGVGAGPGRADALSRPPARAEARAGPMGMEDGDPGMGRRQGGETADIGQSSPPDRLASLEPGPRGEGHRVSRWRSRRGTVDVPGAEGTPALRSPASLHSSSCPPRDYLPCHSPCHSRSLGHYPICLLPTPSATPCQP